MNELPEIGQFVRIIDDPQRLENFYGPSHVQYAGQQAIITDRCASMSCGDIEVCSDGFNFHLEASHAEEIKSVSWKERIEC